MPFRNVIIVTGTPGTGKTTFSREFAKRIGAHYLPLRQVVSAPKSYLGYDRDRHSKIVNPIRARRNLITMLSKTSGSTIVDTHMPEGIVPRPFVRLVFVLRCHPRILETRLSKKGWTRRKIRENVMAEILDICLTSAVKCYGRRRVFQLNTSHSSVSKCVANAERILRKPVKREARVDWIGTLGREHLLDRFLV